MICVGVSFVCHKDKTTDDCRHEKASNMTVTHDVKQFDVFVFDAAVEIFKHLKCSRVDIKTRLTFLKCECRQ